MYTVTELNKLVKSHLESNYSLKNVSVEGEITNLIYHPSGHLYFHLKDKLSLVKCVSFNYKLKGITNDLKNGEVINIVARVTLYETSGQYQILCDSIKRQNKEGDFYEKLKALKDKLTALGYFSLERKRKIPLCFHIGVVTAGSGAVLRDIVITSKKKFPNINITVFPTRVQGDNSEYAIAMGIEYLNKLDNIDVIIVGRGGGSSEDLKAFDTEVVANAIFNSSKPIISAVGHETDFVISDYVSDKRASTPTQAADIATPNKITLEDLLVLKSEKLFSNIKNNINYLKYQLSSKIDNYVLRTFEDNVIRHKIYLSELAQRLDNYMKNYIAQSKYNLDSFNSSIKRPFKSNILDNINKLEYLENLLNTANPQSILKKGYTILENNKGEIILNFKSINKGDEVNIVFSSGKIKAKII